MSGSLPVQSHLGGEASSGGSSSSNNVPEMLVGERVGQKEVGQDRPVLPLELLVLVAEFTAGNDDYATLAHLNITCRLVREETLPVLCETVTIVSDFIGMKRKSDLTREKEFLERHGKHVRYLVVDHDFQIPWEVSNTRVQLIRGDRVMENLRSTPRNFYRLTAIISDTVSASTLDHLIALSCPTKKHPMRSQVPPSPMIGELKVIGSGRIVRVVDQPVPCWTFAKSLTWEFSIDGMTKGLEASLRYLYQYLPVFDPPDPRRRRPSYDIVINLFGNAALFDTFVKAYDGLMQINPHIRPFICVFTNQITLEQVIRTLSTLTPKLVSNWPHIAPPLRPYAHTETIEATLLRIGMQDYPPQLHEEAMRLSYGVGKDATGVRPGVTFTLTSNSQDAPLYRETFPELVWDTPAR